MARTNWRTPCLRVQVGEVLTLVEALQGMAEMQYDCVNTQSLVDRLFSSVEKIAELGVILKDCKAILANFSNFEVKFVRHMKIWLPNNSSLSLRMKIWQAVR